MKDYWNKHKKPLLWTAIAFVVIFITSFLQSLVQSAGFSVTVTDLRNATNEGVVQQRITYNDDNDATTPDIEGTIETAVKGEVVSGLLFKPKAATSENKRPAVVLTHGYLNNRELQLPFAIELARRGFVVLAVDREGHGNYNNVDNAGALMATKGLYESAKYVYNLDYVDKNLIGISGHSMGGFTTAMALRTDSNTTKAGTTKFQGKDATTYGLGIIKAGLIQGWSTFMGASPTTSVGLLKAKDDEFFFKSTDKDGNPTISRQFLTSTAAKSFVGLNPTGDVNVESGAHYVAGTKVDVELGTKIDTAFRAVYEADEIHPLNHWSIPSTKNLVDFFYAALGTPSGAKVKKLNNQTWWVKEMFSFVGMLALLSLIFPIIYLLLATPMFASLTARRRKVVEEGRVITVESKLTPELIEDEKKPLKKWQDWLYYFIPAVVCTLVAGFSIKSFVTEWGDRWFPNTAYFPQDTTNWVALWSVFCGLFAMLVVLVTFLVRRAINQWKVSRGKEGEEVNNPFEVARISSFGNALKTILLAGLMVAILYLIVFINWKIWVVDFRLWTLDIKVFNVPEMLPTMLRYFLFFGLYYLLQGIANQTYRAKNLPEWATIAINAFFNVFGISLVMIIQYATFKSTGVLWQSEMALGYIVLFPIVPILIFATIISRLLYKKTGNVYLGSLINGLLFTIMTVANTASSMAYIL